MEKSSSVLDSSRNNNQLQLKIQLKRPSRNKSSRVNRSIPGDDLFRIIVENLPILWKHYDEIVERPELYFSEIDGASINMAFIGFNDPKLYLGDLLVLWKNGHWIQPCDICGEPAYVFRVAGSPLSGSGGGTGFCQSCNAIATSKKGGQLVAKYVNPMREFCTKVSPEGCQPLEVEAVLEMFCHRDS